MKQWFKKNINWITTAGVCLLGAGILSGVIVGIVAGVNAPSATPPNGSITSPPGSNIFPSNSISYIDETPLNKTYKLAADESDIHSELIKLGADDTLRISKSYYSLEWFNFVDIETTFSLRFFLDIFYTACSALESWSTINTSMRDNVLTSQIVDDSNKKLSGVITQSHLYSINKKVTGYAYFTFINSGLANYGIKYCIEDIK